MLKLIGAKDEEQSWPYCESILMKHFGASLVHSFDNSAYEGATFLHDFNKPIMNHETYDTVIDFGSLEHIYNVSQAFANVSALCAVGGQILHALPANNQCGHGFWQFSPELFYSLIPKRTAIRRPAFSSPIRWTKRTGTKSSLP